DIGSADTVVLEPFVKGPHTHFANACLHQLADAVVDHGGGDAGLQAEAIGEVGGDVVFPAGDVDNEGPRPAKRDLAGVEAMNQSTQREEIQIARILTDRQTAHEGISKKLINTDLLTV